MNLTESQETAIKTHDKNIIVSAGAGSGKTHVLVERYLALLDKNRTWHLNNIVAITFTKKAADEMRDRVRQKLEEKYHQATTAHEANAEDWAQWLSEIDGAQINTIHGLCADLLRANFAEAGLDPDFAVLDEVQSTLLLEQTVSDVFAQLAQTPDAPEMLVFDHYPEYIVREIVSNPNIIAKEMRPVADVDGRYAQFVGIHAQMMLAKASQMGAETVYFDDERWHTLRQMLTQLQTTNTPEAQFDAIATIKDIKLTGKRIQDEEIKAVLTALRDFAKSLFAALQNAHDGMALNDRVHPLESAWMLLMERIRDAYTSAKHAQNALDFDDLENRTHALITQNHAVVMRYRGTEILHLMVDEFQDTNPTQWGIVQGLGGGITTQMTFLVGDDKQSIYGFRGADVSVFHAVRGQITNAGGLNPALNTSFRTRESLVKWFNHVFGQLLKPDEALPPEIRNFQVGYGKPMKSAHLVAQAPSDYPPVHLLLINNRTATMGEKDKLSAQERREWEAETLADHIRTLIVTKTQIRDKKLGAYRPAQYRDMVLLFRAMTHVGIYEEVFKRMGIPFVTVAGKGYYDRQEVWDMIHLLQTLHNPSDDLALVSLLRSPIFGMSDDGLLALRLYADEHQHHTLWEALPHAGSYLPADDGAILAHATDVLHQLHAQMGRVSLAELLRMGLEQTHYLATLSGLPDGDRRRGNIEKLLEKASASGMLSLGDFVNYWRNLNDRQIREGEAPLEVGNAVTLMTVHASKGLEYPIVFIPDATRKDRTQTANLIHEAGGTFACKLQYDGDYHKPFAYQWVSFLNQQREQAESLRLFYVAATRAGDMLIMSGYINTIKSGLGSYGGWMKAVTSTLGIEGAIYEALSNDMPELYFDDVQVFIPQERTITSPTRTSRPHDMWQTDFSAHAQTPLPLLADVQIEHTAPSKHLSATTLADLGAIDLTTGEQKRATIQRFRQKVFRDAPERVMWVSDAQYNQQRTIGEVVHEALRHWQLPNILRDDERLYHLLENYAWRYGAQDEAHIGAVVHEAMRLLRLFERHPISQTIHTAKAIYRELPFVFKWDDHLIHGVIDVLCQTETGWTVYDYKTSALYGRISHEEHARRYHLQVAIYAHAVERQVGALPSAHIYYVRDNTLVTIAPQDLREALAYPLSERIKRLEQQRG